MLIFNYRTIADVDNQLPHYRCYMYCTQTTSAGFISREALDISTCETPLNPPLSRLQRLLRHCSALWDHMYEMPMTVSKILYTFTGGYLDFEVLDLSLPGLYVNLALQATIYLRGLSKINMIHKLYINISYFNYFFKEILTCSCFYCRFLCYFVVFISHVIFIFM
jgi:hypothetical protein